MALHVTIRLGLPKAARDKHTNLFVQIICDEGKVFFKKSRILFVKIAGGGDLQILLKKEIYYNKYWVPQWNSSL